MKLRSRYVLAVTLAAFLLNPMLLAAQQTPGDPCACFAPAPPTPPPGGDGPGDDDDDEGEEEEEPTQPGGGNNRTHVALLGVAGLAALTGIPFGGTVLQGLPFAQGAAPPAATTPVATAAEPGAPPTPVAAPPAAARGPAAAAPAPQQIADLPLTPGVGGVPPKTATHLPLMLALGLALVGGGGFLARRDRSKRRRKRFVAH